jgi:hypothetical protein
MSHLKDSPAFTGIPTAPTATAGTNTAQIATCAFVTTAVGVASGWSLLGNAGTTASNFIGTTDAQPVRIRVNNTEQVLIDINGVMHLGNTTASGITGMERWVINDNTGSYSDFSFVAAGGGYPTFNLGASGGTPTARTALASTGIMGNHLWWGYDGATWIQTGEIVATATSVATGSIPTRFDYKVNGVTVLSYTSAGVTLSGTPAAPTATAGTNTTQIATTAFVTAADALKAPLASPALTGTPTAPTPATADNSTTVATTAYVKAQLASTPLTGTPTAPTAAVDTATTQIATTAFVVGQSYLKAATATTTYAPLASPALTGTPTAPTAAVDTATTQLATTAFVIAQFSSEGVNRPTAQIAYGNSTGTGLTSSASFTWDSVAGLSVAGPASVAGNLTVSADAQIAVKIRLNAISDPAIPAAGTGYLYAKSVAGRVLPKWIGPAGIDEILQPHLGQDKVCQWSPPGNATTVSNLMGGAVAFTAVGTATARNVATTNMATRTKRLGYVSATGTGSLTSIRTATAQYTLGVPGTPNMGGFFLVIRFVPSDAATTAAERFFAGVWSTTTAPTNVEPSTLTNCIGLAQISSSNNLQIVYGGSAAQTAIDLGANFPANTLSADLYELILFAPPNSNNTVYYKVSRLNTAFVAEGTLTAATPGTQLPLNTTLLSAPVIWKSNNTSSTAVGFDLVSAYIETDQ